VARACLARRLCGGRLGSTAHVVYRVRHMEAALAEFA